MWDQLVKQVDSEEATPLFDQVYLGCTQCESKPSLKIVQEIKDVVESLISAGTVKQLLDWEISHSDHQTSQALVTGSCPFCDCSSEFVYEPKNVRSTNSTPPSWSCDHPSKELKLCTIAVFLICQFTVSLFALLSMSFQSVRPCDSVAPAEIRDSNISQYWSIILSFSLHLRWVHPKYTWSKNDVGSPRSSSFINFFHMGAIFCFLPTILMSFTYTDKNNRCFRWTNRHSQFGTLPIRVPIDPPQTVFATSGQAGVHTGFVQEEPLDLRCLSKILAICVVEDVSTCLDPLTLDFFATLERPPFLPGVSWYCVGCLSCAIC